MMLFKALTLFLSITLAVAHYCPSTIDIPLEDRKLASPRMDAFQSAIQGRLINQTCDRNNARCIAFMCYEDSLGFVYGQGCLDTLEPCSSYFRIKQAFAETNQMCGTYNHGRGGNGHAIAYHICTSEMECFRYLNACLSHKKVEEANYYFVEPYPNRPEGVKYSEIVIANDPEVVPSTIVPPPQ